MAYLRLVVCEDEKLIGENVCNLVKDKASNAINQKGVFVVGVSGGSLAKLLCSVLPKLDTDWSKWKIFFCDERHVPYSDQECTYKFYKDNLLPKISLPRENIFPINPDISVEAAAAEYSKKIKQVFPGDGLPRFDLLFLGIGPDGHTCSLFPDHSLLQETTLTVAPISDSPKPPPRRVTLTLPVLNNAACAAFIACGSSKAEILKRLLEGNDPVPLPSSRVKPTNGELIWFMDSAAAQLLQHKSTM